MADEIFGENREDAARNVSEKMLKEHWAEICVEIEKLPKVEALKELYLEFNVKSRLSDIGVDENKAKDLLKYSPMVRNRLTLMRLRSAIKNI